ncbi:MAG: glycosyltransferase family 2 protein [Nitrospinaceae bacterium]
MLNFSPSVTVIIPTYNRGYCLGESIRSVMAQTRADFELLVVDDGSTDGTENIVRRFPEVRYIRCEKNSGVSRARNLGVQQARGRYLCFLDSDDVWREKKLETQISWMESHRDCPVSYTDEIWIRRGRRVNPMNKHRKYSGDIFRHCLPLCIVSPSSVMMRASLFSEVGGFDEKMPVCEDYDLWLRIAFKYRFHFIEKKLIIKQGGHEDQLSRRYWGMDRFRVYALKKLLDEPSLDGERRRRVLETFLYKCGILIQGFSKRGKAAEAGYYRSLAEHYSGG